MKLGKTKKLRGKPLTDAVLTMLATPEKWPHGVPFIWDNLAAIFDVTRQAIERKPLVVNAFHDAQERFAHLIETRSNGQVRRGVDDRLKDAQTRIAELERELDAWREKWIEMEKRCHAQNLNPNEVIGTVLKPPSSR